MTPRFKIGDTISNGRVQYTVLDIETNQNGVLCYIFKNPIKDNNFRWVAEQVDKMFELKSNTPDSFDWESFRAEAAKDILCAMINRESSFTRNGNPVTKHDDFIEMAIIDADALVKALKDD